MTEIEAIKIIGEVSVSLNSKATLTEIRNAYDVVKKSLEELAQLKSEYNRVLKFNDRQGKIIDEYEAIGTVEDFKALKEKSTPKKAEYKKMVYPSHKWKEENGKIDVWAYEAGYCNGPVCERCYYSFCEHCNPNGYEGECVVEDYICPSCRENVGYKQTHCKCGQVLDWQ